jgi:HEAT repeat protein
LLNAEDWALRYAAVVSLKEIATSEALSALQQALTQEQSGALSNQYSLGAAWKGESEGGIPMQVKISVEQLGEPGLYPRDRRDACPTN